MLIISGIFHANFSLWQDVVIIMLFTVVALFLITIALFHIYSANLKEKVYKELSANEKKKRAEDEYIASVKEDRYVPEDEEVITASEDAPMYEGRELKERINRKERLDKEERVMRIIETAEMTKKEIGALMAKEGVNIAENFILNAVTAQILKNAPYRMTDRGGCPVAAEITGNFTKKDVADYIMSLAGVEVEDPEKSRLVFKTAKRTAAMLLGQEGNVKLTVKCGPSYGSKLIKNAVAGFGPSVFPKGLIWFTIEKTDGVSLEMFKLLIDISYKISKLGY